jgi:hypothetical protein
MLWRDSQRGKVAGYGFIYPTWDKLSFDNKNIVLKRVSWISFFPKSEE